MARDRHIQAIFTFSKSVPQFMSDALAFKQALTTAPGNTRVTIPPESFAAFDVNLERLRAKQAITSRNRRGSAAARNIEWGKTKKSVRKWIRAVQSAADNAPDILTSIAIIKDCGLRPRKDRVYTKPDMEVLNDSGVSGLVHLISKAMHRRFNAIYFWEVSRNGSVFTKAKTTTKSRTTWQTNVAPGTRLTFRKSISTNKSDEQGAWSPPFTLIIT